MSGDYDTYIIKVKRTTSLQAESIIINLIFRWETVAQTK